MGVPVRMGPALGLVRSGHGAVVCVGVGGQARAAMEDGGDHDHGEGGGAAGDGRTRRRINGRFRCAMCLGMPLVR